MKELLRKTQKILGRTLIPPHVVGGFIMFNEGDSVIITLNQCGDHLIMIMINALLRLLPAILNLISRYHIQKVGVVILSEVVVMVKESKSLPVMLDQKACAMVVAL